MLLGGRPGLGDLPLSAGKIPEIFEKSFQECQAISAIVQPDKREVKERIDFKYQSRIKVGDVHFYGDVSQAMVVENPAHHN